MGLLSDFFIAADDDPSAYDCGPHYPAADRCQFKGLSPLQAAQLLAIFRSDPDEVGPIDEFELANQGDPEEGPWTCKCPDDFTGGLAALDRRGIETLAAAWAKASAAELGWPVSDFVDVLSDLQRLAARAQSQGRTLFLWNCL